MILPVLATTTLAYAWLWSALGPHAEGVTYMVSHPMMCIPKDGQVVRALASRVICASFCNQLQGLVFSYVDGVCDVFAAGEETYAPTRTFTVFTPDVWSSEAEIAMNKAVDSSPAYVGGGEYLYNYKANDGDDSTLFATNPSLNHPWWIVDLVEPNLVLRVDILTRQDCCPFRFHDVEIRVGTVRNGGDFSEWALIGFYKGPYTTAQGRLVYENATGICGRYVSVQKVVDATSPLQISDIKVYAAVP